MGWRTSAAAAALAVTASVLSPTPVVHAQQDGQQDGQQDNVVLQWNDAALQAVRTSALGPPMVARALAIVHTCVYDAWAAYDDVAVGTRYGGALRRPPAERTAANQARAISEAAYEAAGDLFPSSRVTVFDPLMDALGYAPADGTTDPDSPAGVGRRACEAVLGFRHHDGANQLGDEPGAPPGVPYADYTGFHAANPPMDLTAPFDPGTVEAPDRWQPLRFRNAAGAVVTQSFVAPQWYRVVPFALPTGAALRAKVPPPTHDTPAYRKQARELLDISARLTDVQKAVAEYWADGPRSELPPGHWDLFAQYVSHRDHNTLGDDVKLFFALTNAVSDAGIAAWDDKRAYDSVRPITAIRYLFAGKKVRAWAGPYQGTRLIDGATWLPYQRATFPTPPFPEYASGHSSFSAAGAEVLRLFTGSDAFGASVTVPAGSSAVEPGAVPRHDVTLRWRTFSDAADQAGLSRRYGGIHFERGDLDARDTGRRCADAAWQLAQRYFTGSV